jgi:hypothetical protein
MRTTVEGIYRKGAIELVEQPRELPMATTFTSSVRRGVLSLAFLGPGRAGASAPCRPLMPPPRRLVAATLGLALGSFPVCM